MDIVQIQALIAKGKVVSITDIDPTQSFVQIGVYQPDNRKIGSANNTYPSFVIPLSELGGGGGGGAPTGPAGGDLNGLYPNPGVTWLSGTSVYNSLYYPLTNPANFIAGTPLAVTTALGYTPENVANKSTDVNLSANSDTLYPSQKAVKTYIDSSVTGVLDDRGNWDASGNMFPSTGGSGIGGAILKGDLWFVSVGGILGITPVIIGDNFRALVDSPGQIAANWNILNSGLGYIPQDLAEKDQPNGYAGLDVNSKIALSQIPFIPPRVLSTATASTLPINVTSFDAVTITALATAITFSITGTPVDFQKLTIRIKDNNTAKAITWPGTFINRGAVLPATTTAGKIVSVGVIYNSALSTWDCVAVSQEV